MSRQRRHHNLAFTMIELVLVMLLLTTILAISVPSLRGFLGTSRERDAANQLVAVAQWAEARSVAEANVYRLNVDGASYWLSVQDGQTFVPIASSFGQRFTLPEGMRVEIVPLNRGLSVPGNVAIPLATVSAAAADATGLEFRPDGQPAPAALRLVSPDGAVKFVAAASPAESYRLMTEQEVARL